MLEFEDLEERFAPSKDSSSSGKAQAKTAASSSSSVYAVPPLTLQGGKTSKISSIALFVLYHEVVLLMFERESNVVIG